MEHLLLIKGAWILDVIFFVVIALGILIGVARGFVKGICKLAGTFFAVGFAVSFCVPLKNSLESWFGLTTALGNAIKSAKIAGWLSIAISFVALVIVIKLGAWLLGKAGSALVGRSAFLKTVDRFLGGLLGIVKALLVLFILLAIFKWISIPSVNTFIGSSSIVGRIYNSAWFTRAVRLP